MNYYLSLIYFFMILGCIVLILYFSLKYRKKKQLEEIEKIPFKAEDRKLLFKIPHYKNLSEEDKTKIERSIIHFVYTKEFAGVKMEISDEQKDFLNHHIA